MDPWDCLASLACLESPMPVREPVSENRTAKVDPWCARAHMHAHTNTYTHAHSCAYTHTHVHNAHVHMHAHTYMRAHRHTHFTKMYL